MIYPPDFERKSGFAHIREELSQRCTSRMGRDELRAMGFLTDPENIGRLLGETREFTEVLCSGQEFSTGGFTDLENELERLKVHGTWPEAGVAADIAELCRAFDRVRNFFSLASAEYPLLWKIAGDIILCPAVIVFAERILNEQGEITANASPELQKLLSEHDKAIKMSERKIRSILAGLRSENLVDEQAEITIRNGRCVIPVPAARKRAVRGLLHDESATGQTVFIEPQEVFELNNRVRDLGISIQKEIIRILREFADILRPCIPEALTNLCLLGRLDFIRAKALYALDTACLIPAINPGPGVNWIKARNPILEKRLAEQGRKVIPADILLNAETRILVISGPNAGGKSVCLKTAGLLQYMIQCGIPVPADAGSEAGIFTDMFIEIGDEQSIENDLSTYSSHLRNIKFLAERAGKGMLFLIDEFGSGTEPQMGGAIAGAVMEMLTQKGAYGIVTTHYSNLKEFAARTPGVGNGSMLFDTENLIPLYELRTGVAGSSFALEIAIKTGLPGFVTDRAKEIAGDEKISFEYQLQDLERRKRELAGLEIRTRLADDFLAELIQKYSSQYDELTRKSALILDKAKEEARNLLSDVNRQIENTIREIRESQASGQTTRRLRIDLANTELKLREMDARPPESLLKLKKPPPAVPPQSLVSAGFPENRKPQVGDYVKIPGQQAIGQIVGIVKGKAQVEYNNLKISIPVERIEPATAAGYREGLKNKHKGNIPEVVKELWKKTEAFSPRADVRGMRAEEVISYIDKWIDDALILKVYSLTILHGRGGGVLRGVIRKFLGTHPGVQSFESEHEERGGDGITLLTLRK